MIDKAEITAVSDLNIFSFILAAEKCEGIVGISKETPKTSAPSNFNQEVNHDPLNPV